MKKKISCIAFLILIVFFISGCSQDKQSTHYSIKICGFSDSIPNISHEMEYKLWSTEPFYDKKAPQNAVFSVAGQTIEAKYVQTDINFYEFYDTHRYRSNDGSYFETTDNGKLSFYFSNVDDAPTISNKVYSKTECIDIACEFVGNIIDATDYTIVSEFVADRKMYIVTFLKYVDGFKCADQAEVWVRDNGSIYSFSSSMLGQISVNEEINFSRDIVKSEVMTKLENEYSNARNVYDFVEYEILEYILTIDKMGKYVLICTIDVNCTQILDGYENTVSERIQLLIQ